MRSLMRSPSIGFAAAIFGVAICFGQTAQGNQIERANFDRVYQYETPEMGRLYPTFRTTYVAKGNGANEHFRNTQDGVRLTAWSTEFEYGVTGHLSLATYFDLQDLHGDGPRFIQSRIESRYRFSDANDLPVNLALYGGYYIPRGSFNRPQEMELRLIVEKDHEDFRFNLNPKLEIATTGPAAGRAPRLGFDAAVAWRHFFRAQPALEYYSNYGAITHPADGIDLERLLFPTVHIRLSRHFDWQVGAGIGLNDLSGLVLVKSILTYHFQELNPRRIFGKRDH